MYMKEVVPFLRPRVSAKLTKKHDRTRPLWPLSLERVDVEWTLSWSTADQEELPRAVHFLSAVWLYRCVFDIYQFHTEGERGRGEMEGRREGGRGEMEGRRQGGRGEMEVGKRQKNLSCRSQTSQPTTGLIMSSGSPSYLSVWIFQLHSTTSTWTWLQHVSSPESFSLILIASQYRFIVLGFFLQPWTCS